MKIQQISSLLRKCVYTDDVMGVRSLLERVNERDRKLIVAKGNNENAPLFVAALHGNVDMVECLVTEWQADMEERGRIISRSDGFRYLGTPLWLGAVTNQLGVVKRLIDLGADVNTPSDDGSTPVLQACFNKHIEVVKCLVRHGADVKKPNTNGATCLMSAVQRSCKELCQILIENGADINAHCSLLGNTALHCAIIEETNPDFNSNKEDIVQLLIDHEANPFLKNEQGDDAFRIASIHAEESILRKLLVKFNPRVKRLIESYKLLGASHVISGDLGDALACWQNVFEFRRMYSFADVDVSKPNPVYQFVQEVNEELLSHNTDLMHMYALMIHEQVLGPHHERTIGALLWLSLDYRERQEYRRCIDVCRYALQLQNTSLNPLSRSLYLCQYYMYTMYHMCLFYCEISSETNSRNNVVITFEEVVEVLQMAAKNIENGKDILDSQEFEKDVDWRLVFMKLVLHLISLITKIEMNSDQQVSFKQTVYRLVRSQLTTRQGQTLLHLSVLQSTSHIDGQFFEKDERFFSHFPSIAAVELLLECGANVNAVDDKHNTALHLCSKALRNQELEQYYDLMKRIVMLLLKNEAHVDMVNISGESAAHSLTSSLIEMMNMMNFVSLKCLAANAVVKYKISYVGRIIVASLESFVRMHEIPASSSILPGKSCLPLKKC